MAELSKIQDLSSSDVGLSVGYEYKITVTSEASTLGLDESAQSDDVSFGINALNCVKNNDGYWTVTGRGFNTNSEITIEKHNGELITEIAENAFINDKTLVKITIPKSVKKIGANAFSGCTSLESVIIEDSDETIIFFKNSGNWSAPHLYYTTDSSTNKWPGETMTRWDKEGKIFCFAIPSTAKSITFSSGDNDYITSEITNKSLLVNNMCFEPVAKDEPEPFDTDGDGTTDLSITHSTKADYYAPQEFNLYDSLTIAKSAFQGCTVLESKEMPKRVAKIGAYAFKGCTKFGTLTFPNSSRLVEIGACAFDSCESLTYVKLPLGLATMDTGAFQWCSNLETVEIPAQTLEAISFQCFYDCTMLAEVKFTYNTSVSGKSKLREIGTSAFQNCYDLKEIDIPKTVTTINILAFVGCVQLKTVSFKERKGWFVSPYDRIVANELIYVSSELTKFTNDTQNLQTAAGMLTNRHVTDTNWYGDWYWHKLTKMLPPTISLSGSMLTMTDPLGIAEKFYIYVNPQPDGSCDKKVTIENG